MAMGSPATDAVGLAHALYAALASGDHAALDQLLHSEFVGETTEGLPLGLGGRYEGPKAMRRNFWGAIGRAYDAAAEPSDVQVLADGRVLVIGRYRGSARSTGTKFEADFVHVLTLRDGQIAGLTQLTDSARWAEALQATPDNAASIGLDELTTLTFSVSNGLAHITLDRPDAANAINRAVTRDLRAVAQHCASDPAICVVLITGNGERFCAGGDIQLFAGTAHQDLPHLLDEMITDYHVALDTLANLRVPVVCGVQGAAAGGGLGLLHVSDIVVVGDDAKFAVGYSALGLSSDGGNTWFLPRLVGAAKAAQLFFQNRVLSAAEALEYGMVSEVVAPSDVSDRALHVAEQLAAGPTQAFATMRGLLRSAWDRTLTDQLDSERRTIVALAATQDAAEGIAAFAQKRSPEFRNA